MSNNIDGSYNPKEVEEKIYEIWRKSESFQPKGDGKSFSIVLPPPNVTGALHMGHALNATIQDILVRKKRMEGYKTLWIPGTDHAGIATQNVVEKNLIKTENKRRHDLGREKFIEKVWEWKEEYGNKILSQLKKIGASCDWTRTRFTMDEEYQEEVKKAFMHYYDKGWIYKAERVINWCSKCQTSLSDLELEYKEEKGKLYWIKYGPFTLATTRPETKLGDTAVAVNPKDDRYKDMVGKEYDIPGVLGDFKIRVVADRVVDPEFGSGAVKVTPAHSIVDSEIGERHNLPVKKVINEYGKIMDGYGKYSGLSVKDAREEIVKDMQEMGLIEKIEDYTHNVATCYRCGRVVENLPSEQWFLKMDELAKKAIGAVESKEVKFHPEKWEKGYLAWHENIRDWCISRQIWWGHKIPVEDSEDVLDTWFSSALWAFATMKGKDREEFYPTNVLSTARDIINLWVARMVFSGLELEGKKPFSDVIIHPTILNKKGQRMSKSLGTGVDPMDYIEKFGADATRFGLIWQMMGNQDIHWAEEHVLAGKKFCNKIWNASRFVLTQTENFQFSIFNFQSISNDKISNNDKQILEKLETLIKDTNQNIEEYKFGQALHDVYDFFWHEFCDIYLEESKNQLEDEKLRENTQEILSYVLINSLKLLHPFMPFITEEIWSKLPNKKEGLLIIESWPSAKK
ncbi:MAG: valine--tRNA ligase [Candidatus Marinimicrobia bacterium]|nr:valine--tRNA ligase [Candidatus Neomarinimicrobiota bacterium]